MSRAWHLQLLRCTGARVMRDPAGMRQISVNIITCHHMGGSGACPGKASEAMKSFAELLAPGCEAPHLERRLRGGRMQA